MRMIQILLLILLKSINSPKNKKIKKLNIICLLRKALAQKTYLAEVNKNRKS